MKISYNMKNPFNEINWHFIEYLEIVISTDLVMMKLITNESLLIKLSLKNLYWNSLVKKQ